MNTSDFLNVFYVVFGFAAQILLIANFALRNWKPELERTYGWIIYALGVPSLILGLLILAAGRPWYFVAAPLLFSIWAAFGYRVDIWRPIPWRTPPRRSIFGPYVALFVGSLLLFWFSMWYLGTAYWIAFGLMYAGHTLLNIYSHRGETRSRAV